VHCMKQQSQKHGIVASSILAEACKYSAPSKNLLVEYQQAVMRIKPRESKTV